MAKASTKTEEQAEQVTQNEEVIQNEEHEQESAKIDSPKTETVKKAKKRIDPETPVTVYCNIGSNLVYRSEITNRLFSWSRYGSLQEMELKELQNMPESYFKNNWVRIEEQEIIDYLRVGHFYKDAIDEGDIEGFFDMDVDEMESFLDHIKPAERALVINRVKEKIANKTFDSANKIRFIERKYGITLQE